MSKVGKVGKRKKTGGRKKGTPNKITLSIKQAVIDTFGKLGAVAHMTNWAKLQPSEFYRLAARLIPTEVTGAAGGPVQLSVVEDPRETARRMAFLLACGAAAEEKGQAKPAPKARKKLPVPA